MFQLTGDNLHTLQKKIISCKKCPRLVKCLNEIKQKYDVRAGFTPAHAYANDGLKLNNCYITAMARCAPPQNKPTPKELKSCFPYFVEEIRLLKNIKVVVCLGKVAFDGYLKWLFKSVGATFTVARQHRAGARPALTKKDFIFSHGAIYKSKFLPHILIASYHPSRQNTQTGKLTKKMFKEIFEMALRHCEER